MVRRTCIADKCTDSAAPRRQGRCHRHALEAETGVLIRGRLRENVEHIASMKQTACGAKTWQMHCQSPGCRRTLAWNMWLYKGKRLCIPCTRKSTANTMIVSEFAKSWADRIVRVNYDRGGNKRYWVKCEIPQCGRAIELYNTVKRLGRTKCAECAKAARTHLGFTIKEQALWDRREDIVSIKRDRQGTQRYSMRCKGDNCTSTYQYHSERQNGQRLCAKCAGVKRRGLPFPSAASAVKSWHQRWGGEPMSRAALIAMKQIKACFYCQSPLSAAAHRPPRRAAAAYGVRADKGTVGGGSGLDRVDSTQGYTAANSVPCCWACNRTKSHMLTFREMFIVQAVRQKNQKLLIALLAADSRSQVEAALSRHGWSDVIAAVNAVPD